MGIIETILSFGSLGIFGFLLYWFAVILRIGPEVTEEEVDESAKI